MGEGAPPRPPDYVERLSTPSPTTGKGHIDEVRQFRFSAARYTPSMPSRAAVASALRHLAPHLPAHESSAVVDHAMDSPGLSVASPENAAWLSLVAYARHTFTDYDALLAQGYDRDSARFFVAEALEDLLAGWGVKRKLGEGE